MRVIICTVPIREHPSRYPPVASTSIIEHVRQAGYDSHFYDIDALRPSFEEVVSYFERERPDIIGISAVVSTSYAYVKKLVTELRRILPGVGIVLGGGLAASSEVILQKTAVDICVIGEGEHIFADLLRHWEKYGHFKDNEILHNLKGIVFRSRDGGLCFTGYGKQLERNELRQPNYDLLKQCSDINRFIYSPFDDEGFTNDPRAQELSRRDQKCAKILTSKGCVSRCTFCHRWDKGYRTYDIQAILDTIQHLKENYNVGFYVIGDENFGSDARHTERFLEVVKPLDILFRVSGVRVSTVFKNLDIIKELKNAGCTAMYYGIESGSQKMLGIMEKRVGVEENSVVLKETYRNNMYTVIQLVIGMPGENDETIEETIDFLKDVTGEVDFLPSSRISINFYQALPGTPGYEYLRLRGMIGKRLYDEEQYLMKVSNVNAASFEHYVNCTGEEIARVLWWRHKIMRETDRSWRKGNGLHRSVREKNNTTRWRLVRSGFAELMRERLPSIYEKMALYKVRRSIGENINTRLCRVNLDGRINQSDVCIEQGQSLRKAILSMERGMEAGILNELRKGQ